MKYLDPDKLDQLPGRRLMETEAFAFDCHPGIGCFNQCCRNLNLFLYPYDVERLKNRLDIPSDRFLDRYVDVVMRPGAFFPDVLLKMSESADRSCCYLTPQGCGVYTDRPDTCRKFPMEQGILYDEETGRDRRVYFFLPPDFCQGPGEKRTWTPAEWNREPDDARYDQMTLRWAGIKRRMEQDPWAGEGPEGPRAKMTFMAAYNIDKFRAFVFESTFLKRYQVKPDMLRKIKRDDAELLNLAFAWIRFYLWGLKTKFFHVR